MLFDHSERVAGQLGLVHQVTHQDKHHVDLTLHSLNLSMHLLPLSLHLLV